MWKHDIMTWWLTQHYVTALVYYFANMMTSCGLYGLSELSIILLMMSVTALKGFMTAVNWYLLLMAVLVYYSCVLRGQCVWWTWTCWYCLSIVASMSSLSKQQFTGLQSMVRHSPAAVHRTPSRKHPSRSVSTCKMLRICSFSNCQYFKLKTRLPSY